MASASRTGCQYGARRITSTPWRLSSCFVAIAVVLVVCQSPSVAAESDSCSEDLAAAQTKLQSSLADLQKSVDIAEQARADVKQAEEKLMAVEGSLGSCERSLNEKSCAAVESELATLLGVRRNMAADLDSVKQREAQLKAATLDLEARVTVLNAAAEELGTTKDELSQAKTELNSFKEQIQTKTGEIDIVNKKIRSADESRRKLEKMLEERNTNIAALSNRLEHTLSELAARSRKEYIFSLEQLNQNVRSFATFFHGVGLYTSTAIYNGVSARLPAHFRDQIAQLYQTHTQRVELLLAAHVQPHIVKLRRLTEDSEAVKVVQGAFSSKFLPALVAGCQRVQKTAIAPAMAVVRQKASNANSYLDDVYVAPLLVAHPELKALIPATVVDRLCLLLFCVVCSRLLLSSTSRAARLVATLASPWRWCGASGSGGRSASTKTKSGRSRRKAFTPASGVTGSANAAKEERQSSEKRRH